MLYWDISMLWVAPISRGRINSRIDGSSPAAKLQKNFFSPPWKNFLIIRFLLTVNYAPKMLSAPLRAATESVFRPLFVELFTILQKARQPRKPTGRLLCIFFVVKSQQRGEGLESTTDGEVPEESTPESGGRSSWRRDNSGWVSTSSGRTMTVYLCHDFVGSSAASRSGTWIFCLPLHFLSSAHAHFSWVSINT